MTREPVLDRPNGQPVQNSFMTGPEYDRLAGIIREEFGIALSGGKVLTLHAKIGHRLAVLGLSSYSEYIRVLEGPDNSAELDALAVHITNNETFFQREKSQYEAFSAFLPEIKRRKQNRKETALRILSAGCSTGEEAYNLNIIVMESGLFAWNWEVAVTGVDLDRAVIKRAVNGVYPPSSFRSPAEDAKFKDKYFSVHGQEYRLKPAYKANVSFRQGSILKRETFDPMGKLDVIFCRNVFIYMGDEALSQALGNFYNSLDDHGYLFVSASESLLQRTCLFAPEYREGVVVYRKKPA